MENLNWCAMWGFLAVMALVLFAFTAVPANGKTEHEYFRRTMLLNQAMAFLAAFTVFGALFVLTWGH